MRHNKKRNAALMYEYLIRHISKCLVEKRQEEAKKTALILKNYFSPGTALKRELDLFNVLVESNLKNKKSMGDLLSEVLKVSSRLNAREIDSQKSRLIKEVNYTFNDKSFYSAKVDKYKLLASIQVLLNESRNKKKSVSVVDKIKIEDGIIESLSVLNEEKTKVNEADEILEEAKQYNTNLVYKVFLKKFYEKYSTVVSEGQRSLLFKYVSSVSSQNPKVLSEAVKVETKKIKDALKNVSDVEVLKDKQLMKKLNESYKSFVSQDFENLDDEKFISLLQYVGLAEEVSK